MNGAYPECALATKTAAIIVSGARWFCDTSLTLCSAMESNPLYTAAKYGIVGLTRATGPILAKEGITVNCICPAFIITNLCPPHVRDTFPKEHITPMSTVLKAFDTFINDDEMTGQSVELSLDNLYFRKQPDWPNESQRWIGEDSVKFWEDAYKTPAPVRNGV